MFFAWLLEKVWEMSGDIPFSAINQHWRVINDQILTMYAVNNTEL